MATLDRFNVSFAALQMNEDLGLSQTQFGLGAGIFFVSYCLCEIPSNFVLARVGARLWFTRIMVTWGLVVVAMMFIQGPLSFYGLRLLLGAAEAGLLPGVLFYITQWLPKRERTGAIAKVMAGAGVAGILGGPIAGILLTLDGVAGLAGWQWMFLVEGLLAVALAWIVWWYLPDSPAVVTWLTPQEREWIRQNADPAHADENKNSRVTLGTFFDLRVWFFAVILLLMATGLYGQVFWMPQLIQAASGYTPLQVGALTAVLGMFGIACLQLVAWHSAKVNERRWHVVVPAVAGGFGLAALGLVQGLIPLILAMLVIEAGGAAIGPFWAVATAAARRSGAAIGIALINVVGAFGGFLGPYVIGFMLDRASAPVAFVWLGALLGLGGILILIVRDTAARQNAVPA